jgi:fluoroquinolone transport system permease protein
MTRLLSTLRWEVQLQFRYGFYYAGLFVAVVWIVLASVIPQAQLRYIIPVFLFTNLVMTTFYFASGLILLEQGQRTLQSLIVTPLRRGEYLSSKALSLTLLGLLEGVAIVAFTYGLGLNWLWLSLGLALLCTFYVLTGIAAVARYQSINEFLLPSGLWTLVFSLPLIHYFELWRNPLFYLLPTYPPLILLKAAFESLPTWQLLYGVLGSLVWIGLAYELSRRFFERYIVQQTG